MRHQSLIYLRNILTLLAQRNIYNKNPYSYSRIIATQKDKMPDCYIQTIYSCFGSIFQMIPKATLYPQTIFSRKIFMEQHVGIWEAFKAKSQKFDSFWCRAFLRQKTGKHEPLCLQTFCLCKDTTVVHGVLLKLQS